MCIICALKRKFRFRVYLCNQYDNEEEEELCFDSPTWVSFIFTFLSRGKSETDKVTNSYYVIMSTTQSYNPAVLSYPREEQS